MKQYSYFLIYLQAISPVRNWRVMVLIIKIGMMKKSWLLYFMGLIALCGCSRVIAEESGEKEICFQVNIHKMQEVNMIGSRAGLNAGDRVGLYIVEQEGEGLWFAGKRGFLLDEW